MSIGPLIPEQFDLSDPDEAFRQIVAGVDVLEGRLAETASTPTEDDLLMTSLAFSLERLARETSRSVADPRQREQLAEAAARIRAVIAELSQRERVRLPAAPDTVAAPAAAPEPEPVGAERPAPVAAPAPRWDAARVARVVGATMLAIGLILALFIAYEFLFTGLSESRSQRAQLAQFDQRLRTGTFDNPSAAVPSGPVALLEIPVLGTRQIVSEGSSPSDLRDGPGHLPGTPLPGEFGNAVVLGHNHLYGGPFGGLHTLVPGDQIIAVTGQGRFLYLVTDVQTVSGGQRDVVGASADSRLTLVTSSSVGSSARLAVTAQLDGDPVAIPKRPQTTAGRDELGTTGDILGLPLAVIWGGVLAGTLFAATRLYRRWPRTAAYVITTPIILMALWLLFRSLDLLLPGTL